MRNIIRKHEGTQMLDDQIYFPIVERDNAWIDRHGAVHRIAGHKSLIAYIGGKSHWLANVGKDYKVITNRELFTYVTDNVTRVMAPDQLQGMQITHKIAYGGRDCYQEMVFPNMRCDLRGGDVAFKLIIGNSYGAKAVTLICGAVDFWCSNGMIFGSHEKTARKHTSGITLVGLEKWIKQAQAQFVSQGTRLEKLESMNVHASVLDRIKDMITDQSLLSARHAEQIMESTRVEADKRTGSRKDTNLWHMYSALTNWASHGSVRDTGNDHEASTRIERSRHVERVMHAVEGFLRNAA
jgi:hypothetical protein